MEFNVKKYIQKIKEKTHFREKEKEIENIIFQYTNIPVNNIMFYQGIVTFPSLQTSLVVVIKKNKKLIIQSAKEKKIYIRDIL